MDEPAADGTFAIMADPAPVQHIVACPACGFAFRRRPEEYLKPRPAARRLRLLALYILIPVLLAIALVIKFGKAWWGFTFDFSGAANAIMLMMMTPSLVLFALSGLIPKRAEYRCQKCGWTNLDAARTEGGTER